MVRRAILMLVAGALACEPTLDQRTFAVSSPRVLAVRAEPAEVPPGTPLSFSTLYVGPDGEISAGPFDWAFCEARNPLANLGPVNPACVARGGPSFVELGASPNVSASLPADACRQFGPDVPTAQSGQPPGRPVDPDATGGYYQPVRLAAGDQIAIGMARITCTVVGATPEQLSDLSAHSHANTNPALASLADTTLGALPAEGAGTISVSASQRLSLRATWATCASTDTTCTGSEAYAYLDPQTHSVVYTHEQMRASWFATGGTFDDDRTGRDATDPTAFTDNGWTAPASTGTVHVWVVLRDDRGGVGWRGYVLDVK